MPKGSKVQLVPLLLTAAAVIFCALHHGSYSVIDRQQLAVAAWLAIALLAAFGRLPRYVVSRPLWVAVFTLAAGAVWALISAHWSESVELSLAEFVRSVGYAGLLLLIAMAVGRRNWRMVAAGLLFAAVAVCALAVLSRCWPSIFPRDDVAATLRTYRLSYPLGYWNAVGAWSAMTICCCLAWSAHARSALVRGLALAAIPLCASAIYLTLSRAATGGAVAGCLVVILLSRDRWLAALHLLAAACASAIVISVLRDQPDLLHATGSSGAGTFLITLAIVGAGSALFAVAAAKAELGTRMHLPEPYARIGALAGAIAAIALVAVLAASYGRDAIDEFRTASFDSGVQGDARLLRLNGNRVNLWRSAWRAFESEPLQGRGAGTFAYWWNRDGANEESVRDAHNIYLEALAETGVLGLILVLACFLALLAAALSARRSLSETSDVGVHAGLTAAFVVFTLQAGFDWLWESTAVSIFALTAIACAAAAAARPLAKKPSAGRRTLLVAVAALAVFVQLPGIVAGQRIESSQAAYRAGDRKAAIEDADAAIAAEPWSAAAYGQRALVYEGAGDLDRAISDLKRAERKEPTNWVWPLIGARVFAKAGQRAVAQEQLRRAKSLRHHSDLFSNGR